MRWKNQSNVFPQGEIIQEKSLDNSQAGLHRLAGKTDITLTLMENERDNRCKMLRTGLSYSRCSINRGG